MSVNCKYSSGPFDVSGVLKVARGPTLGFWDILAVTLGCSNADFDVHLGELSPLVARWSGAGGRR